MSIAKNPSEIEENRTCFKISLSETITSNINLISSYIKAKLRDDLLIGTEHSEKIVPDCKTPNCHEYDENNVTDDEKIQIVQHDPKFGMFSLFKYHLKRGYTNDVLKKKNAIYSSHIFSLLFALPIIVFLTQWFIYISLMSEVSESYSDNQICPADAKWQKKMTMIAVTLLYFVRSFFLWDNLTNRTRLNKMTPSVDIWVMLDTFQEFGFNLMVYGANLWIVFNGENVQDMILDSLAMEFIMNLDNEFQSMYFEYVPEAAIDIYDHIFITYDKNQERLKHKRESLKFRIVEKITYIPFKILVFALMLFPVFCLFMIFYGAVCI